MSNRGPSRLRWFVTVHGPAMEDGSDDKQLLHELGRAIMGLDEFWAVADKMKSTTTVGFDFRKVEE